MGDELARVLLRLNDGDNDYNWYMVYFNTIR